MRVVVVQNGRYHSYVDEETDQKIPGVTTLKRNGLPTPRLTRWHADVVAEYALDHWRELDAMALSERYKVLKRAPYAVRDTAADKGRAVHRLAQSLTHGDRVAVPAGLEGYTQACVDFLNAFDFQPWYSEAVVFNETRWYAGRLDSIGTLILPDLPDYEAIERDDEGRVSTLIDWKTNRSGIFGDSAYQLAGYRHCEWLHVPGSDAIIPMPQVSFTAGVHLTPDGFDMIPLTTGPEQFRDFLYLKECARIVDEADGLRGEPVPAVFPTEYVLTKAETE